jgi:UDP-N-acetylglucosamine diphosphorylase / glucose-1-phosphate thymidylyltransferase / UDP-N-acetylgalactosamine diphosphorylase / glucosamine-1-phosphate N-acetyltransferase / galactosamine-1-phosphate N-acetyltransferase
MAGGRARISAILVSAPRIAVVAAAGKGRRIHPKGVDVPKVMLEVAGKPLLVRNLELLRDALGIRTVWIVVGHRAEYIRRALGDGSALGLELRYIENPDVDGGLGTLFTVVEPHVTEPFVLMLGDELYVGTNHAALAEVAGPYTSVCAIHPTDDAEVIAKNYSVTLDDGRITGLVEKPEKPPTPYVGCGTYLFDPVIFRHARETPRSTRTGRLELTDVIDRAARAGERVLPFELAGHYLNVNTVEDLNAANYLARALSFSQHRVSVVIPAYNEAASIGRVVRDFRPHVDEIVVMDNVSPDGTGEIARSLGAVVHSKPLVGYGDALRQGMDAATGDIMVLVEADGTFKAKDLGKLLEFLKDADMVIGTRTTRQMIEQGANMDGLLRWGNVVVGKLIEALWWSREPRFTDVGCTYRAIWRDAYLKIRPYLTRQDAAFSPEMMIEMLRIEGRVIEIPVSYYRRLGGASKHSASLRHSIRTGMRMVRLILQKRLNLA